MDCTIELWPASLLPPLVPDLRNAAFLAVGLVVLMVSAELGRRFLSLPVELTRKAVHLAAGVTVSFIPCLISSVVTVVVVSGGFFALMLGSKRLGLLSSVHGVSRRSSGAFVYPLSILAILVLSGGDAVVFQISVLVLALSDAMAAVVGVNYGRYHYKIYDQLRSLEGSIVFFIMTFLVVHIPLLLSGRVAPAESLLIALLVAALVTCFEAICVGGWDNMVIPVATLFTLNHLIGLPASELCYFSALLGGFALVGAVSYRLQRLSVASLLAALLLGYGAQVLGGLSWSSLLLVFYLSFHLDVPLRVVHDRDLDDVAPAESEDLHDIRRIFYLFIVATALLVLNDLWPRPEWHIAFVAVVSLDLAVAWGMYGDFRAQLGTDQAQRGPSIRFNSRWLGFALAAVAVVSLLGALLPSTRSAGVLLGPHSQTGLLMLAAGVSSALLGLAGFLAFSLRWHARFRCPSCGEMSRNVFCHGARGEHAGGWRWLDFDRAVFAGTVFTAALAVVFAFAANSLSSGV